MKECLILLLLLLLAGLSGLLAQTFSEWFKQKKTQISYLEKQIVALEVYKQIVEKGYEVTKDGTNVITEIKQGDLQLHVDRLGSLKRAKASIRNDPRVREIPLMIRKLREIADESVSLAGRIGNTETDLNGIAGQCKTEILRICNTASFKFAMLTEDGPARLTDDERLSSIGELYELLIKMQRLALTFRTYISNYLKNMLP